MASFPAKYRLRIIQILFRISFFAVDVTEANKSIFSYFILYFFRRKTPFLVQIQCAILYWIAFYYAIVALLGSSLNRTLRTFFGDICVLSQIENPKVETIFAFNCSIMAIFAISQFMLLHKAKENLVIRAFLIVLFGMKRNRQHVPNAKLDKLVFTFRWIEGNISLQKRRQRILTRLDSIHIGLCVSIGILCQLSCLYVFVAFRNKVPNILLTLVACELQCIALQFVVQHGAAIVEIVNLCLSSCNQQIRLINIRFRFLNSRLLYRSRLAAQMARFTALHDILALLHDHSRLCYITTELNRLFQVQILMFLPIFVPISQDMLFMLLNGGFFSSDIVILLIIYSFIVCGLLTLYFVSYVILFRISAYNANLMSVRKEAQQAYTHLYGTRCTRVKAQLLNYWEAFEQRRSIRGRSAGVTIPGTSIVTKLIVAKFTILYFRYTILTWRALIYKYKIYHFEQ